MTSIFYLPLRVSLTHFTDSIVWSLISDVVTCNGGAREEQQQQQEPESAQRLVGPPIFDTWSDAGQSTPALKVFV